MTSNASAVIAAFNEDQVQRLTHLSRRQLRYWDDTGFFAPAFAEPDGAPRRLYSFKDVVGLRTIQVLLTKHRVTLQHLRRVAERLSHMAVNLWSGVKLYVHARKVVIVEPETQLPREVLSGQYVMSLALSDVIVETRKAVAELKRRPANTRGKLEQHRGVVGGRLVVAGTRVPVRAIQEFAEAGYSVPQIIAEYPDLKPSDVKVALKHHSPAARAA